MKNPNRKDYEKGCEIAEQIASIMQCEPTEDSQIADWLANDPSAKYVTGRLTSKDNLENTFINYNRPERGEETRIFVGLLKKRREKKMIIRLTAITTTVAVAMLVLSLLVINHSNTPITKTSEKIITKPMLILDNGNSIDLTEKVEISGIDISEANKISYLKKDKETPEEQTIALNSLVIPSEYKYIVELSDGTIVHLNANTTIKYPTYFSGDTREVFINGEAYFEVMKSDKPFIVTTDDLSVRVYGTKFNLNTYRDNNIETLLISGSVGVTPKDGKEIMITPNQLFSHNKISGENKVENVNSENYIGWIHHKFLCENKPLDELLSDIENWYGIIFISNNTQLGNLRITLSVDRTITIENIIKVIESTTKLKIIYEGGGKYSIE